MIWHVVAGLLFVNQKWFILHRTTIIPWVSISEVFPVAGRWYSLDSTWVLYLFACPWQENLNIILLQFRQGTFSISFWFMERVNVYSKQLIIVYKKRASRFRVNFHLDSSIRLRLVVESELFVRRAVSSRMLETIVRTMNSLESCLDFETTNDFHHLLTLKKVLTMALRYSLDNSDAFSVMSTSVPWITLIQCPVLQYSQSISWNRLESNLYIRLGSPYIFRSWAIESIHSSLTVEKVRPAITRLERITLAPSRCLLQTPTRTRTRTMEEKINLAAVGGLLRQLTSWSSSCELIF